jgi:hypothetical protein
MATVQWKFVLADSSTMTNIGELQCTNKQLEMVLNRAGSCTFQMAYGLPLAASIVEGTTCIKCYRKTAAGATLIWSGPVWNVEDSAHGNSVNVSAAGWLEILNHRQLRYQKSYSNNDKTAGQIALDLLAIANAQKDGPLSPAFPDGNGTTRPTGILVGTTTDTGIKNRIYNQWQSIGQAITEWTDIENGYDLEITPDTKNLNIYASAFPGTLNRDRTQAQFGFNWGPNNLLEFSRTREMGELVNSQFATGALNSSALAQDTTSMSLYGLFESTQNLSDVYDINVLQAFANGEVAVRSAPKTVYRILPQPYNPQRKNVPEPFVDYRLGDHVYVTARNTARIQINKQAVRVFGITVSIDDQGSERITTLQVSP